MITFYVLGYVAVLNAIVEAEVETPKDPVKLTLKDNGAGN